MLKHGRKALSLKKRVHNAPPKSIPVYQGLMCWLDKTLVVHASDHVHQATSIP